MLHVAEFVKTLPIMLYGMLGIFMVIFIIFLVIKLMNWAFPNRPTSED